VSRRTHFGALSGWAQKTLSILGLLVIVWILNLWKNERMAFAPKWL
jgi:hypothetical protein